MINKKPFIHSFKTGGGYYLYDVNTDRILKLKKSIYDFFSNKQKNNLIKDDQKIILKLKENGFLLPNSISEIVHPDIDKLPYLLNNKIAMITLQITQNCNLKCKYCIYSGNYFTRGHSKKTMTFDVIKKGIDFYINKSKDIELLNVGFYGGEPLLKFDLIKQTVDYTEEKTHGKKVQFSITTNGTLLTKEIVKYCKDNNFLIIVSLDGPKTIHNKNRKFINNYGSFDLIMKNIEDIKFFFPEYLENISFMVVIDPENDYNCINDFFTNYEIIKDQYITSSEISDDFVKTDKYTTSENYTIKKGYEIFKIFLSKLNRLNKKYASPILNNYFTNIIQIIHNGRTFTEGLPSKVHHGGPCIPGALRLFMSVDGTLYPCERVSETSEIMKIGHVDKGFDIEKIRKLLNLGKLTEYNCKKCWAIRHCTLCASSADDQGLLSVKKKASRCKEVINSVENILIDYCTLKEFGYDFDDIYLRGDVV